MIHNDRFHHYEIRVEGHIGGNWFEGLDLSQTPAGETIIRGEFDQAALQGVFNRIRDLGLVLLLVQRVLNEDMVSPKESK